MKRILLTIVRGLFALWMFGNVFLFLAGEIQTDTNDPGRYFGQLFAALVSLYFGILCFRSMIENKKFWSLGNTNPFKKLDFGNWKD